MGWSSFQTPHWRKILLQRAVAHRGPQDLVACVSQGRVWRGEDADVMPDRDRLGLNREAVHESTPAFGEHVVEQHRIDAAEHEVTTDARRPHAERPDAVVALGAREDVVRDRAAECPHVVARRSSRVRNRAASNVRTLMLSRNS